MLRRYQPEDAEAVAQLFSESVKALGSSAYNAKQVQVWSSFAADDLEAFRERLKLGITLIAWRAGQPVAFGQLYPDNQVAFMYTSGRYARSGYASVIFKALERQARGKEMRYLRTEASRLGKHFFLRQGFLIDETEFHFRNGVVLERYWMTKILR